MLTLTCEQTLTLVADARPEALLGEHPRALATHLVNCDDCENAAVRCARARELMGAVRGSGLSPDAAVALADHLIACDDCRTHADDMRVVEALLAPVEVPDTLSQRLSAATREHLARQLRARAVQTVLGWAALAYSDNGLVLVHRYERTPGDAIQPLRERLGDIVIQDVRRDDIGDSASRKLVAYHEGARVQFDEPVDLSLVSPFTQQVLRATARIPYGEVRPYAWVASEIGRPRAARAVGGSLHINPAAPIIPCHRVIASDNTLGGYGGGLEMKKWLLRLEGYLE
jgi:methylated-DNA-[protein]-cysteine S-methyltransferase